jgi:hypothetical protein
MGRLFKTYIEKALFLKRIVPFSFLVGEALYALAVVVGNVYTDARNHKLRAFTVLALFMLVSNSCATQTNQYASIETRSGAIQSQRGFDTGFLVREIKRDPNFITQTNAADIQAVFRDPELARYDAPATVWHYVAEECVMDVYFTEEEAELLKTKYVEFRDKAGVKLASADDTKSCLNTLL